MALEMKSPAESQSGRALRGRITKQWTRDSRPFRLDAEFQVAEGITILFGPSGAGKTTLLDCIAGVSVPDDGRITVGDEVFFDRSARQNLAVARRCVGYVFQDLALFPHMTAAQNIEYGVRGTAEARRQQMQSMMDSLRIAHLAERRPAELSGGERQRVALARALATNPCLLLLDEPLAALDAPTKSKILDDLRRWNEAHRIPILYVTHSREEVFALGERILMLEEGRITAEGTPHQVMRAPRRETVAQLAGFENIFDAAVVAVHEDRGTMTCRIAGSQVELETPLVRAEVGSGLRIGIRAGDILLATLAPSGLSARNVIRGTIEEVSVRDVIVSVRVNCGVRMEAHLTLAARDSLALAARREVWLVVKTHSCHLMMA